MTHIQNRPQGGCQAEPLTPFNLIVSQFTLAGDVSRGNRPGFSTAAAPDQGRALYQHFIGQIEALGIPTATGAFGADMAVSLTNDGPVTLWLDI